MESAGNQPREIVRSPGVNAKRIPLFVGGLAVGAVLLGIWLAQTSPRAVAAREAEARAAGALTGVASPGTVGAPSALEVEVQIVRLRPVPLRAELAAVLGPARRVTLAAEVEGPIVAIAVEEHSMVEAGAVLVQVERSLLEAAVERQEAQLSRARADHDLAKLDLGRQLGLKEKNVGSAAELDRARAIERARRADRQQARASLTDARVRLDKATIRAPFAGVVQKLDLEPGAYLRPGDPVAEILDLSEIEIEVGVIDRQVVALRAGDPVSVLVDVFPDEVFGGVIRRLGRSPDDRTQKFPVEVRVANQDGRLLPGMLGRVRFDLGEREPTIRVPRAATRTEYEISYVFVLDGQDPPRVSRRRVATRHAPFRPDLLEVTQGLREGERIAVTRVGELRDGLRVRPLGSGG